VGRGCGDGRGRGVGGGLGVDVAVAVAVAVGVADGATVAVAVAVAVGVGLACGQLNISIVANGVTPSTSYPPANQMLVVPSVSVGKLRRALLNGIPSDQVSVPGA